VQVLANAVQSELGSQQISKMKERTQQVVETNKLSQIGTEEPTQANRKLARQIPTATHQLEQTQAARTAASCAIPNSVQSRPF